MIKDLPLVSVVMPNYNTSEAYLRAAIESILKQSYQNIEFIIVDDASTGNDIDIIKSYHDDRIVLLQNECNRHVSYSLNRGLGVAKGKYIARMDSDDVSLPKRIEKQVRFLQKRSDIDILSAQAEYIGDIRGVFKTNLRDSMAMKIAIFFSCPIVNPSVMFRTDFIRKNSLKYRTDLEYKAAEDYEFWSRCVSIGELYEFPQVLIKYRTHEKQVSESSKSIQIQSANRVRKNILSTLGIAPSLHETNIHYNLCIESILGDVTIKEIENWASKLLKSNKQYGVFHSRFFKQMVMQHFFITAVKSLLRKQVTLRQIFKFRLMVKALSPLYYPVYLKRLFYLRRMNGAYKN